MDDSHFVGMVQRLGQPQAQFGRFARRRPVIHQVLAQGHAVDVLAGDVDRSRLFPKIENLDHRGMPEAGRRPCLLQDPGGLVRAKPAAARNLQGHQSFEQRVPRPPDRAEPSFAQRLDQLEAAKSPAGLQC